MTALLRLPVYSLQQLLVHEVELCEVVVGELLLHLRDVGEVARADLVFSLQLRVPAHTHTHNANAAIRSEQINTTYRPSRFFINSFFFPSLPNTEGMSFFRLEMM